MGLANGRWRPTPTATRPASIRPLRKSSAFPPLPACEERSGRVSARVKGPLRRRFFRIRPLTLPSPRMRGEETKTTPRSPPTASPQRSRRSPDCSPKAIHSSRTAKPGRRTARRGPKNPKAASASPSSPTSSPPAINRRPSPNWWTASGARSATRCFSASPAPAKRLRWPRSSRRRSALPSSSRRTRRWRPSSTASSSRFSRTTPSSISCPTTTITSRRPTFRARTPTSRRKAPSTSRSTACATPRRAPCSNATTSSSWPPCPASTASVRSKPIRP